MTSREAALKSCKDRLEHLEKAPSHHCGKRQRQRAIELEKVKIEALRPITREQVEMVWKGCPECKPRCGLCVHMGAWDKYGKPYVCEQCVDYSNFESEQKFCEVCGSPLTDKAVDMVMERLEEVQNDQ